MENYGLIGKGVVILVDSLRRPTRVMHTGVLATATAAAVVSYGGLTSQQHYMPY